MWWGVERNTTQGCEKTKAAGGKTRRGARNKIAEDNPECGERREETKGETKM